jgi:hypothetical protein
MSELPDFQKQEDQLFEFTRAELSKFAAQSSDEFAYFAFDCNPDYGEVLLCLDTTANSIAMARVTEKALLESRRRRFAMPYCEIPSYELEWSIHRLGNDLEGFVVPYGNNTGDFSHQGFAQVDFDDWQDYSIEESDEFPDSKQSRIKCFAAVLLAKVIDRLVDAEAFAALNRSHPFYCGVGLHDGPQRVLRMVD